jgi:hypothetical protein
LKSEVFEKSFNYERLSNHSKLFFFFVPEMGKSLPLESDEKEKCINVKTLLHVASRCTRKVKRMRKVL